MAIRTGTSYFVSLQTACKYYADYGYTPDQVARKVLNGEIHLGKPPLASDGSERWVLIDDGTRYGIEDS